MADAWWDICTNLGNFCIFLPFPSLITMHPSHPLVENNRMALIWIIIVFFFAFFKFNYNAPIHLLRTMGWMMLSRGFQQSQAPFGPHKHTQAQTHNHTNTNTQTHTHTNTHTHTHKHTKHTFLNLK